MMSTKKPCVAELAQRLESAVVVRDHARCDCGKPARSLCGIGIPGLTLIPCKRAVCGESGSFCGTHRHAPNTMGYLDPGFEREIRFSGFRSDGGLFDAIRAFIYNRMPERWQAQRALAELRTAHPPPAPLPTNIVVRFRAGGVYKNHGDRMVPVRAANVYAAVYSAAQDAYVAPESPGDQ